jgi:hypothetical protein
MPNNSTFVTHHASKSMHTMLPRHVKINPGCHVTRATCLCANQVTGLA